MKRLEKSAIILSLLEKLKNKGSWCGETHVQKAVYFLEEVLGVDLSFEYVLYKHGPYSFELSTHLKEMMADNFIDLEPTAPLGCHLVEGDMGGVLKERFHDVIEPYKGALNIIADFFNSKGVADLEKEATALYSIKRKPEMNDKKRAAFIHSKKPHISEEVAMSAISSVRDAFTV